MIFPFENIRDVGNIRNVTYFYNKYILYLTTEHCKKNYNIKQDKIARDKAIIISTIRYLSKQCEQSSLVLPSNISSLFVLIFEYRSEYSRIYNRLTRIVSILSHFFPTHPAKRRSNIFPNCGYNIKYTILREYVVIIRAARGIEEVTERRIYV